ncbi:hypothetical protein [Paracoccus sp. pheM1]|uniref:hypothetical protein n=1 Tax=Paracoccus sp. pheM1 TaxID=2831675 RepID=UPI001BDB7504|nr:hypothetical protein [Paracoccus sp. pheM1]MBT0781172.1 hypothetical protein [Paracoccus sp. pheM1]
MKRRDLMRLAPAALAAGAVPVAAVAAEETPVMRVFSEWKRANDFAHSQADDEAFEKALGERWEVEQRLMQTPSQNERDVLIKIIAWTNFGDGDLESGNPISQPIWDEARALVAA